jgi:hypothetical protein
MAFRSPERSRDHLEEEVDEQPPWPRLAAGKRAPTATLPRPMVPTDGRLSPDVRRQLDMLGGSAAANGERGGAAGIDPFAMFGSDAEARQAVAMAEAERSPSAGLPGSIRGRLEGALGEDLADVRLHQGSAAAGAAELLGAHAFAVGNSIYFGSGAFDLSSPAGLHLLAHEVAHTVQQRGALARPQLMPLTVGPAGDAHEVEADSFAVAFATGAAVPRVSRGVVSQVRAQPLLGGKWEYAIPGVGLVGGYILDKTGAADAVVDKASDWAIDFVMNHIGSAVELLTFLVSAQTWMVRKVIAVILEHRPQILKDLLMLWPGHAVIKVVIDLGIIPWEFLWDVLALAAQGMWYVAKTLFEVFWKKNPAIWLATKLFSLAKEVIEYILHGWPAEQLRKLIAPIKGVIADFFRWLMNKYMPVGRGFSFGAHLGMTPIIPVHVAGDYEANMTRAKADEIAVYRRVEVRVAADSGASAGMYVGTKDAGVGATAGYSAEAGVKGTLLEEFEFPVLADDALLGVVIAFFALDMGSLGPITELLFGPGVDPHRYNTKAQIEAKGYAQAAAGAEIGLKTPGDKTESGKLKRGDNVSGGPDVGSSPWWSKLAGLSASIMAQASAEAGLGCELEQKWGPDRSQGPESATLKVYAEAEASLQALANIPNLPMIPQLPALNGGVGAKLIWDAKPDPSQRLGFKLENRRTEVYVKRGDVDRFMGTGSEVSVGVSEKMLDAVGDRDMDAFKAELGKQKVDIQHRMGLQWGTNKGVVAKHAANLRSMLPNKRGNALVIEGFIGFKAEMQGQQLYDILVRIVESSKRILKAGPKKLLSDFIHFLQTGEGPAYIRKELDAISDAIAPHVKELILRAQAAVHVMGHAELSEGVKVRLDISAMGGITVTYDLLNGGEQLAARDIKALFKSLTSTPLDQVAVPLAE